MPSSIFSVPTDELFDNAVKKNTNRAMIAIDGGGTKNEFILFNQNGRILGHTILGGSNPGVVHGYPKA